MTTKTRIRNALRDIKTGSVRRIRSLAHRGTAVRCNLCDRRFSHFMPTGLAAAAFSRHDIVGGGQRENAKCPRCVSIERTRLVLHYLDVERHLFDDPPKSMLHVAPEARLRARLSNEANVDLLTVDLHSPFVDEVMDIVDIGKPDDSFDVILCSHVLEHVPDDRRAMRELFRILKPGGFAILQVPLSLSNAETLEDPAVDTDAERLERYGQIDHVRLYGQDYASRLESAGFRVEAYLPRGGRDRGARAQREGAPVRRVQACRNAAGRLSRSAFIHRRLRSPGRPR